MVGHGHRRKHAHDEGQDWIHIRRGLCNRCGKTFTFLPPFSLPYCHYSQFPVARIDASRVNPNLDVVWTNPRFGISASVRFSASQYAVTITAFIVGATAR